MTDTTRALIAELREIVTLSIPLSFERARANQNFAQKKASDLIRRLTDALEALPPSTGSARAEEWRPESPREIYDRALASWNEVCPGKENEAMRRGYIAGFSNALSVPPSKGAGE